MKKFIISLIGTMLLSMPYVHLVAGSGDAALGLVGGMVIGSAISSNRGSRRSRRAEERAQRAEDKVDAAQQTQQRERIYDVQRQMAKQDTGRTINILILMVALLFFAVLGLGAILLKRK